MCHGHNSKITFLAIKLPKKNHIKNNILLETLGGHYLRVTCSGAVVVHQVSLEKNDRTFTNTS